VEGRRWDLVEGERPGNPLKPRSRLRMRRRIPESFLIGIIASTSARIDVKAIYREGLS
jgi:hypothetical protein